MYPESGWVEMFLLMDASIPNTEFWAMIILV